MLDLFKHLLTGEIPPDSPVARLEAGKPSPFRAASLSLGWWAGVLQVLAVLIIVIGGVGGIAYAFSRGDISPLVESVLLALILYVFGALVDWCHQLGVLLTDPKRK